MKARRGNGDSELADSGRGGQDGGDGRGTAQQRLHVDGSASFAARLRRLRDPALWSVETPNLYTAVVTVETGGKARDAERVTFGVRTVQLRRRSGIFPQRQADEDSGHCNHQDHAGVGAALPDRLQAFRVGVLQQMGCNAVRTSHNMPTPELGGRRATAWA